MEMKKVVINVAIVLAILLGIVWVLKGNKEKAAELTSLAQKSNGYVAVRVEKVKREVLTQGFAAFGHFEPAKELGFVSETSGRVVEVYAQKGDKLGRGQTMAKIDDELLRNEVASAEVAFNKIKNDLEKYETLAVGGAITPQQLEETRLAYTNAEIRVKNARRKLDDASIKAPFSATVNEKHIEIGTYLNPGAKMYDLVDVSKLKIKVKVTEAQVIQLQKGMQVSISTDILPGRSFAGKITFIGVKADAGLSYPVEVEVDNASEELKPGMYAQVLFTAAGSSEHLTVSREAIVGSLDNARVYVNEGGKAVLRKVTTGVIGGARVAVVSGLSEGEAVINSGQINLTDGAPVQVLAN